MRPHFARNTGTAALPPPARSLLEASPNSLIPDRCYEILDFGSIDRQISRLCRVLGMMGEDGPAPLYDEEEEEALKKDKVRAAFA